jgi:DNA invertase Pin-like site-specific DNA recombinase
MTPFTPRRYGNDSGDRILANLRRAAEAGYAKRRYVLSDADYAAVQARREKRETWKAIAADYGVSHTTLMAAVARYKAAQRKARP